MQTLSFISSFTVSTKWTFIQPFMTKHKHTHFQTVIFVVTPTLNHLRYMLTECLNFLLPFGVAIVKHSSRQNLYSNNLPWTAICSECKSSKNMETKSLLKPKGKDSLPATPKNSHVSTRSQSQTSKSKLRKLYSTTQPKPYKFVTAYKTNNIVRWKKPPVITKTTSIHQTLQFWYNIHIQYLTFIILIVHMRVSEMLSWTD